MPRLRRLVPLLALPLIGLVGCGDSADPVDLPDLDTPQYGPPAGTDDIPIDEPEPDNPALADPGQPPSEEGVPTNAGGAAGIDDEPGAFILNPPSDLEDQPSADGPSTGEPAAEGTTPTETPTADEPEEPGVGQP